ncbi:RNase P modulator RnpM [Virgibacillus halophilus]|uniref:YlxR family protein n=1 Tax=Tigheibacillus halophilus TaxID=361280 RepID=A0ABU5CC26_9BACI|nr:YlxR family protein [Virgibacillus halophilus]
MKKRKTPMRKCVVTNEMMPKKELIRIVRNKDGEVSVDPTGKKNGRGAYVTKNQEVVRKARENNVLGRHLEAEIPETVYTELLALIGNGDV